MSSWYAIIPMYMYMYFWSQTNKMKSLHEGKDKMKKAVTSVVKGKKSPQTKKRGDCMEVLFQSCDEDGDEFMGFTLPEVQEVHISNEI